MDSQFGTLIAGIILQFSMGAGFGWLIRGGLKKSAPPAKSNDDLKKLVEQQQKQAEEMHDAMNKLHELTENIGKDVGDHAGRVKQISEGLTTAAENEDGAGLQTFLLSAVDDVAKANEQLQSQLRAAEEKLAEQSKAIEKHIAAARTDALTGALNRRAFDEEILRRVSEYQRYRTPVSLLMADIDFFKKFNDAHGHQAGDEVLKLTSRTLTSAMRDVDLVCRYGGEEFAIIMPGTELVGGGMAAERARIAIEKSSLEFAGKALKVTMSGGVATATAGEDVASLIRRADEALYASKKAGRNCSHVHDGSTIHSAGATPQANNAAEPAHEPAKVNAEASGDPLQQMPNSDAFQGELRRRIEQQRKYQTPLTIILGSIDGLAVVQKDMGDEGANIVMRATAQFLKAALREHDTVARVAYDRFAMALPGTNLEAARRITEKIRQAVAKAAVPLGNKPMHFTISFGLIESGAESVAEGLMQQVTAALDAAILAGGNRIVFDDTNKYTPAPVIASAK